MLSISIAEDDGRTLKEFLEAKLIDLRREISHTDSPRFRETLYQPRWTVRNRQFVDRAKPAIWSGRDQ